MLNYEFFDSEDTVCEVKLAVEIRQDEISMKK